MPVYLFIKNNPGRRKVSSAAHRSIRLQSEQGATKIIIDSMEISREIGISNPEIVRQLLYESIARHELPSDIRVI